MSRKTHSHAPAEFDAPAWTRDGLLDHLYQMHGLLIGSAGKDTQKLAIIHVAEHPAGKESCPSCGSESRAELYYVQGRTGQPVSCPSDWHDWDAREPGSQELPA